MSSLSRVACAIHVKNNCSPSSPSSPPSLSSFLPVIQVGPPCSLLPPQTHRRTHRDTQTLPAAPRMGAGTGRVSGSPPGLRIRASSCSSISPWEGGGGGGYSIFVYSRRPSQPYNGGTEHFGCSPTRKTLLAPSAKRREVFGESHEG